MENQPVPPITPPTPQPSPPENLPVSPIKKISKLLITTLVLLFLATTGAAGYFVYQNYQLKQAPQPQPSLLPIATTSPAPTPNPTANWETYINEKYRYTIKYPPTLFVQGGPQQIFFIKKETTTAERMGYSDQLVEIMVNKAIQRFESYYQAQDNKIVEGYGDLKLRNYLIERFWAVEYGYDEKSKEKEIEEQKKAMESGASVGMIYFPRGIIINKDGTIIEISTNSYFGEFKQTFDQILSTFKFPDQTKQTQQSVKTKLYSDPDGRYKFSYPSNWKVLEKVPEKFRLKPSYVETDNIEEWLSGKMLGETCGGPIIQNTSDTNQLIVFEVVDAKGGGGFCWSLGYFMDEDKWKVAEKYAYPIGSNNLHEPEWRGDYLKMEKAAESNEFIAFVSLVNYETFQLQGEDVLQSIISSFQFLQ